MEIGKRLAIPEGAIRMTRWGVLRELILLSDKRQAIGKAWPLFFFLVLNGNKSNKFITSYPELKERLNESPSTIKKWKDSLFQRKVIQSVNGRLSMTLSLLPPYDSLVTCEQDDITQVKMKSDPATRRLLDKLSSYNNVNNAALLLIIAELTTKIDNLEKKMV